MSTATTSENVNSTNKKRTQPCFAMEPRSLFQSETSKIARFNQDKNFVLVDGDDGAPRHVAPRESLPPNIDSSFIEFINSKYEANDANIEPIASQPSQIPTSENGASQSQVIASDSGLHQRQLESSTKSVSDIQSADSNSLFLQTHVQTENTHASIVRFGKYFEDTLIKWSKARVMYLQKKVDFERMRRKDVEKEN